MPDYKGVTIKVTTQEGVELDEYGVKSMTRRNFCSAYVQSETDVSFKISLTPDISFFEEGRHESPGSRPSRRITRPSRYRHRHRNCSPSPSDDDYMSESYEWDSRDCNHKSPVRRAPRFHLLATIHIDGRTKYERRVIIYLDPRHRNFSEPDGKVWLTSRWSRADDGTIMMHKWVFKDVGIESMFDKLLLSGDVKEEEANKEDEDAIINAMNSLGTKEEDGDEEEAKVGVIRIILHRIKVGYEYDDRDFNPPYREDEGDDVDMADANKVTHTTGLDKGYSFGCKSIPVINYTPFDEPDYATFKFFYRSKDVLRKFGFANFPRSPPLPPTTIARGRLQETMTYMIPLSVSNPLPLGMPCPPLETTDQRSSENQSPKEKTVDDKSNGNVATSSKSSVMRPSFTTFRDTKKTDTLKGKGKDQITMPLGSFRSVNINDQHNPRMGTPIVDIGSPSDSEGDSTNPLSETTSSSSAIRSFIRSFKGTSRSPIHSPSNEINENEETLRAISISINKRVPHDLVSSSSAETLPALANKPEKFTAVRRPSGTEPAGSDADDEADSSEVESKDALTNLHFTFIDASNGISENRDDHGLHEQLQDITIAQPGMKRKLRSSGDDDDDDEEGPLCLSNGILVKKLRSVSVQSSTMSGYLAGSESSPGHASDNATPTPPSSLLMLLPGITVTAPSDDEAEERRAEQASR